MSTSQYQTLKDFVVTSHSLEEYGILYLILHHLKHFQGLSFLLDCLKAELRKPITKENLQDVYSMSASFVSHARGLKRAFSRFEDHASTMFSYFYGEQITEILVDLNHRLLRTANTFSFLEAVESIEKDLNRVVADMILESQEDGGYASQEEDSIVVNHQIDPAKQDINPYDLVL